GTTPARCARQRGSPPPRARRAPLRSFPARRSSFTKDTFAPLGAMLLVLSDFLDPLRGPEERGGFRVSPTFFILLALGGFVVGAFGHLIRSRVLQAIGVSMILLATVFIPIALAATR